MRTIPVFVVLLMACGSHDDVVDGSGVLVTQTPSVAAFHGLAISQNLVAEVTDGANAVDVEMDDNLVTNLSIHVDDGILVVEPAPRGPELRPSANARIRISAPVLDHIEATGQSSVVSSAPMSSVEVTATGAAHVTVKATEHVDVTAANSAFVTVLGQPPSRSLTVAGDAQVMFGP